MAILPCNLSEQFFSASLYYTYNIIPNNNKRFNSRFKAATRKNIQTTINQMRIHLTRQFESAYVFCQFNTGVIKKFSDQSNWDLIVGCICFGCCVDNIWENYVWSLKFQLENMIFSIWIIIFSISFEKVFNRCKVIVCSDISLLFKFYQIHVYNIALQLNTHKIVCM